MPGLFSLEMVSKSVFRNFARPLSDSWSTPGTASSRRLIWFLPFSLRSEPARPAES